MAQNLKARLSQIRDTRKSAGAAGGSNAGIPVERRSGISEPVYAASAWPLWSEAGYMTLKREITRELPFSLPVSLPASPPVSLPVSLPAVFPGALAILVPDFIRAGMIPSPAGIIFFDLETTGLSGGAGTLAFLAAFGRFVPSKKTNGNTLLKITQYLLLDYPGENDFVENLVKEFAPLSAPLPASLPEPGLCGLPFVVSYNGKSFDSQILNNRCLMNGIPVPGYFHADLLHPSRRLWKRMLPDCSQSTIEVSALGLDRTGDVPGSLAPEIWFSFLKTGDNRELLSVCEHNAKDILGLASIFLVLGETAKEPFKSGKRFCLDEEALALSWRKAVKKNPAFFGNDESCRNCAETGRLLLESAARNGFKRAAFTLALEHFKNGRVQDGRALMREIAEDEPPAAGASSTVSNSLRAAARKSLAIDAEWRLNDPSLALQYTDSALALAGISTRLRKELEMRRSRLEEKIK